MLGGHSTLNTVVLGEGISKYQIPPHFGHHSSTHRRAPMGPKRSLASPTPGGTSATAAKRAAGGFSYDTRRWVHRQL